MLKKDMNINPISATVVFNGILFITNLRICLGKKVIHLRCSLYFFYLHLIFLTIQLSAKELERLNDITSKNG